MDTVTALTNAEESANNPFRIGVLEVFSVYFMGKILAKKFAGRRMELVERSPGEIEMLLLDRQIECGLTYLPYPQPGIEVLKIGGFELHAFAKADVAKGESAEEIPFIIPTTGLDENPLGIKERDGWPDAAFRRNRFHKTNMLSTALDMARNGLGAVFMPDFVAKMHNESHRPEFQLLPIESSFKMPRIKRQLFLLKRTGAEETGEIKKLVAGVREQIREK